MADGVAGATAEEDLPRDDDADATFGRVEHRRPVSGDRVARHLVGRRADRVEDPAERHVLAERDTTHLLVAGDLGSRGIPRDLRVVEVVLAGALDHTCGEGSAQAPRERGEVGAFGRVAHGPFDVHRVLRPHHEIDGRLHAVGRGEVTLEDETLVGRARVRPLWAAALHERDVHGTDVVTSGCDGCEPDHERDRCGTHGDCRPGGVPTRPRW